uniref:Uncharacterized protein n=1 Tax=Arundo donax TaxID=35708 RepID=A0A0A8YAL0_ARUDO
MHAPELCNCSNYINNLFIVPICLCHL